MIRVGSALAILVAVSTSPADEVTLRNGGTLEGVTEQFDDAVVLTTPAGIVLLPPNAIERIVPGPTRWTQYERQVAAVAPSAEAQLALARWCADNNLMDNGLKHLQAALELDPTLPEALQAAGYVQTDGVWIKAGPVSLLTVCKTPARIPLDELARYLAQCWRMRITSIREPFIRNGKGSSRGQLNELIASALELDEPMLAPAFAAGLATFTDRRARLPLAEALGRFDLDAARLNLIALALLDDDAELRLAAAAALEAAKDPRVSRQLRQALLCSSDGIVRRAATALGHLRDRSAVADLIAALAAPPRSAEQIEVAEFFAQATAEFSQPIPVALDEQGTTLPSEITDAWQEQIYRYKPAAGQARPGTLRTEVQEALIAITGENHGFDPIAWAEWLRQNPTLSSQG